MDDIKFSIIIPVYNVENYLKQCVESVLSQDYENYEIILVDDGSSDNSGTICDSYAKISEKIHVIHKKNEGLLKARRTGIQKATGDYFLHLDSDDYWSDGLLKKASEIIKENLCDMIIFNYNNIYPDNEIGNPALFENYTLFIGELKKQLYDVFITTADLNNLVVKICSRDIVDAENNYDDYSDINFGEDMLQSIPLILASQRVMYTSETFYNYRRNTGMTSKVTCKYLSDGYRVRSEMMRRLNESGLELGDSIDYMLHGRINSLWRYIITLYADDKYNLPQALKTIFSTDVYLKAKEKYWNDLSYIKKMIVKNAECNNWGIIRIFACCVKIRRFLFGR